MALFEELLEASPRELIYTVFIPFLIAFAIFWGILSALGIFGKKVNLILSLAIAVAALYYGAFGVVSVYLLNLSANVAVAAFVIIFILGVLIWSALTVQDVFGPPESKARKSREKIEKLYEKLSRTHDPAKIEALEREIERWKRREILHLREEAKKYRR